MDTGVWRTVVSTLVVIVLFVIELYIQMKRISVSIGWKLINTFFSYSLDSQICNNNVPVYDQNEIACVVH